MKPNVVVDVGNTRMKWGRCTEEGVVEIASLSPPNLEDQGQRQIASWGLSQPSTWVVGGVHPQRCDELVGWLRELGHSVWVVDSHRQLPIGAAVQRPHKVGIDRLLNAVAAGKHWKRSRLPAIVIDAGTAVTVDSVDQDGTFRGGAIFPGLRLMGEALHHHTALLPLVELTKPRPYLPGMSTQQAIEAGVYYAVAGGINTLTGLLSQGASTKPYVFMTGGDAELLRSAVDGLVDFWPEMTLEGLRLTAEAQPGEK
jgi:type III pantothenate kinase